MLTGFLLLLPFLAIWCEHGCGELAVDVLTLDDGRAAGHHALCNVERRAHGP